MGFSNSKVERPPPPEMLQQAAASSNPRHGVFFPPSLDISNVKLPAAQRRNFLGQSYDSDEDAEMVQFVALLAVKGLPEVLPEPQRSHPREGQPEISIIRQQPRNQASQVNFSRPIQPSTSLERPLTPHPESNQPALHSHYPRDPIHSASRQTRLRKSQPNFVATSLPNVNLSSSTANSSENLAQSRGSRITKPAGLDQSLTIFPPNSNIIFSKECSICIEDKPLTSFPRATSMCEHARTTCLACMRQWIGSELNAMTWNKLKCMAKGCNATLDHNDVKRLAERSVFKKYDRFATFSVLSTLPNFYWCLSTSCSSGQIHIEGTSGPIFTCVACGHRSCIVHKVPWHTNLTCGEYDYAANPALKKQEEIASEKAVRELARKCPGKACGAPIIRNGGCDHMTCKRCGWEFCWLCFADYKDIRKRGNAAHKISCRLHTRNLP